MDDSTMMVLVLGGAAVAAIGAAGYQPRADAPRRWAVALTGAGAVLALLVWFGVVDAAGAARIAGDLDGLPALDAFGDVPLRRLLFLLALAWCGPPADLVVRGVLWRTGLPGPEAAAASGVGAGRWIGRLERWALLAVIGAGVPALAFLPTTAKAALRYAEVSADERLRPPLPLDPVAAAAANAAAAGRPDRHQLLEYVVVGSLASWGQAIVLGLIVAG